MVFRRQTVFDYRTKTKAILELGEETEHFRWWRQEKVAKIVAYGLPVPFCKFLLTLRRVMLGFRC
jgi:hypothetical protein